MSLGVEYGCRYELVGPDGTKAVFNDSTDPDYVGNLDPEQCSGLDSPDVREDAADAVEEDGGIQGDNFYSRRAIIITGVVIAGTPTQRNERVAKIKRASNAMRADATLTWKPVELGGETVSVKVRRQQRLIVTKGYVKSFQIPLAAADARIYGKERTAAHDPEKGLTTDPVIPFTAALTTDATFMYYARGTNIIRAKLDGTEKTTLITGAAVGTINDIAVNATHIFWTDTGNTGQIGRATIAGASVTQAFVAAPTTPRGIAINAEFIYWAEASAEGSIGRAKLDGTVPEATWLTTPTVNVWDVEVNATHIFWSLRSEKDIGRATIAGGSPTNLFVENASGNAMHSMTIDTSFIYYGHEILGKGGGIGRVAINGTNNEMSWFSFTTSGIVVTKRAAAMSSQGTKLYYSGNGGALVGEFVTYVLEKVPQVSVVNNGDEDTPGIIKVLGPYTGTLELTNKTTGQKLVITPGVAPESDPLKGIDLEERIEIDLANRTIVEVKKTGERVNRYDFLSFAASTWFRFDPGTTILEVDTPVDITVTTKDAYI